MKSTLVSKNINIGSRRTSLRLEREFWDALDDICTREILTVHQLCTLIDERRHGSSRTSAVRAFVITYFRAVADGSGSRKGGRKSSKGAPSSGRRKTSMAPILVVTPQFAGPERRTISDQEFPGPDRRLH